MLLNLRTLVNADMSNLVIPHPDVGDLIFLLRCVLENEFNGKYYKQIIGHSMGAVPSPEISDMKMYEYTRCIESQFQYSNKILFQRRMYWALEKHKQSISPKYNFKGLQRTLFK